MQEVYKDNSWRISVFGVPNPFNKDPMRIT